jgi:hypothetical protein
MAYDSARGVVVLFGGSDGGGETWEWDGSDWTLRATTGPSPRDDHAMAYDSARGVVALFGGSAGAQSFGDTWEWDGSAWALRATSGPSPRDAHAMAYDSARGVVVLFGGRAGFQVTSETWEYGPSPAGPADLDADGDCDLDDLAILLAQLTGPVGPPPAYQESAGLLVIEAEHYHAKTPGSGLAAGWSWSDLIDQGSAGDGYVKSLPEAGLSVDAPYIESNSPHLGYRVRFDTVGTYRLWLRGTGQLFEAVHYGLDGVSISSGDDAAVCDWDHFEWWSQRYDEVDVPKIAIGAPDSYTLDLWMRDDGTALDRLLLTTDHGYVPPLAPDTGPPESPCEADEVVGDLDADGDCDLADVAVFAGYFTGSQ